MRCLLKATMVVSGRYYRSILTHSFMICHVPSGSHFSKLIRFWCQWGHFMPTGGHKTTENCWKAILPVPQSLDWFTSNLKCAFWKLVLRTGCISGSILAWSILSWVSQSSEIITFWCQSCHFWPSGGHKITENCQKNKICGWNCYTLLTDSHLI